MPSSIVRLRHTVLQIPADGPLPDRVHGALTTGEFSWGTFARALAAYADTRDTRIVAGRDVVPLIARIGVSESVNGGKAFAQLYAALALRHFGADLTQQCDLAVVITRRSPGLGCAARPDALLRSENASRHRPSGELSWRRRARRDPVVPDGRAQGSRVRRCAARSRRAAVHERRPVCGRCRHDRPV